MIHDMRRGAKLFSIVSGERSGAGAALTRLGLRGLSAIYYAAFRRRTGKLSRIEKTRVSAPVISVGNITLGGTGKTPICLYLATHYAARGLRVGIATRGYGREGGGTVILKEAGNARSWHVCGDEPMLFLNDPSVYAVAVDADRSRAAGVLAGPEGCDVVILDDGFQFITLERDVDIAVLDAGNPFGHDALFPAGLLREPVAALARADVIWIAKAETVGEDALTGIRERIAREFPGKPVIESRHEPSGIVAYKQCCEAPGAGDMIGRKLVCVSGIGNPAAFENVVARITGQENPAFRFDDHHPFGVGDLSRVEDEAIRCGADYIVTTEKDAARLPGNFNPRCRWLILRVDIAIIAGGGHAEEILTLSGNLFRKAAAPYNIQ